MRNDRTLAYTLLSIGTASTMTFAVLTWAVARRETSHRDGAVRARFPRRRRRRTKRALSPFGPLGKDWASGALAGGIAAVTWRRGAGRAAIALPLAAALSAVTSRALEVVMPRRAPPPGRHSPSEPSFPSGHSLRTTAVALTSAHLLTRERVIPGAIAFPLALTIPVVSGVSRLYLDRHWGSDVAGGWLAGISIATACAGVYEALSD